jgi:hypothetical protein
MGMQERVTTVISTRGQVILPKAIRDQATGRPAPGLTSRKCRTVSCSRQRPLFLRLRSMRFSGTCGTAIRRFRSIRWTLPLRWKRNAVRAIDTSILIRFLAVHDEAQATAARKFIEAATLSEPELSSWKQNGSCVRVTMSRSRPLPPDYVSSAVFLASQLRNRSKSP